MRRNFHFDFVPRPQPDEVRLAGGGGMRQNLAPVLEPYFPLRLRKLGEDFPGAGHGLVNTQGPSAVTATQCSKWAE